LTVAMWAAGMRLSGNRFSLQFFCFDGVGSCVVIESIGIVLAGRIES
jgi:hypothetical protein